MDKKNFTRKDLTNKIHKTVGFSKNFSSSIVDDIFEVLVSEIINSKSAKISSFGTFKVKEKKERIGRNPKTKIECKITPRKVVKFKPSEILKEKLNKNERY